MIEALLAADPDLRLVLSYAPAATRPALATLFVLDRTLGQLLRGSREPMLARLRLRWWHDQLLAGAAGPDPVLAAVVRDLIPKGVAVEQLAEIADGWDALTDADVDDAALADFARLRGCNIFTTAGTLLGQADRRLAAAGEGWALVDLARNTGDAALAARALALAAPGLADSRGHWPTRLRALGALAALARRDVRHGIPFELKGAPARVARALSHRLTGR